MLKFAVCDDEKYYRDRISVLLAEYLETRSIEAEVDLYPSGKEFISEQENLVKYDVVFLDINMEEVDGIRTAMEMRKYESTTTIVLVTAFISYALEGYKVGAVRYIMKDALEVQLEECMDTVLKKMQFRQIAFSFIEGEKALYTDNIIYIESRRHKCIFFYMEKQRVTYQIYEKLDSIEEKLSGYGFLRTHKSFLVNMKHIRKISNYIVTLDSEEELPIPRLRYTQVREAFVAYKGEM